MDQDTMVNEEKRVPEGEEVVATPEGDAGPKPGEGNSDERFGKVMSQVSLAARKVMYSDAAAANEFAKMIETADDPVAGVAQVAAIVFAKILETPAKGIAQDVLIGTAGVASAVVAIEFAVDRELLKPGEKTLPNVIQLMSAAQGASSGGQQEQQTAPDQAAQEAPAGGLISGQMGEQPTQGV